MLLEINPKSPEPRKIRRAVDALEAGEVIAYPTDTVYGLGCDLANKKAVDRLYQIKGMERSQMLAFVCRDLGEVCARNRARGEPELAVLVVRKADRLPGEGFFHSYWRDGVYDGPSTGPAAAAFIRAESERAFAFFAAHGPARAAGGAATDPVDGRPPRP